MTKSLFSVAMGSLVLANSSIAGTATSEAAPMAAAPSASGITGSIAAGYDSEYYFRGLWFSSNNAWGSVNVAIPVADKLTLGLGALYTYGGSTSVTPTAAGGSDLDYSELDLIGSLTYDAGWGKVGFVVTNYTFFDTFSGKVNGASYGGADGDSTLTEATDIGLTFAIPFGDFNLYAAGYYDLRIDATYLEIGADYTYKVSEQFSIVPSAQLGFAPNNYYTMPIASGEDSGLTHLRVAVAAPYKFTDALVLTPYVAHNFALAARKDLNTASGVNRNDFYAGAALSYAF